ncbi:hypothetical protein HRR81_000633 [Exophiala dermatitidis]|nr:hypothetical protein HRR79_000633 [Exophiala dermatitidis]KAJ4584826.1 hypothetical protein HRR81_000633 [Exophiala dermatitidis]KAJ9004954.1 hypothetical protein HRR94_000633 [Exophiala dermatitidis]
MSPCWVAVFDSGSLWCLRPELHGWFNRISLASCLAPKAATERFQQRRVLIPLDCKTIMPILATRQQVGGIYVYQIVHREEQRKCSAYIVQNPAAAAMVLLLPHFFLDPKWPEPLRTHPIIHSGIVLLPDGPPEPMPTEWSVFEMPIGYLAEALQNLVDFALGRSGWRNPYNGIEIPRRPHPFPRTTLQELAPLSEQHSDDRFLRQLQVAFDQYGEHYDILLPTTRSCVGDVHIVHRETGAQALVEVKRRALFPTSGTVKHLNGRKHIDQSSISHWFTPFAVWDFLLSTSKGTDVLFISKDLLPDDWFQPPYEPVTLHPWTSDRTVLRDHLFSAEPGSRQFVREMEKTLERRRGTQGLRARNDRLQQISEGDPGMVSGTQSGGPRGPDGDRVLRLRSNIPGSTIVGDNVRYAPRLSRTHWAEIIQHECRKCGYGAIYELKNHPSGTHFFSPCVADSFAELPLSSPGLFINFAHLQLLHQRQPHDHRRAYQFFRATHTYSPSIFVLSSMPEELDHIPHDYFLVPSQLLRTRERRYNNWRVMKEGWKERTHAAIPLDLTTGDMIDLFAVPQTGIVDCLRRILETPAGQEDFHIEGYPTRSGRFRTPPAKVEDYMVNKLVVLQEYARLMEDKKHWLNRLHVGRPLRGEDDGFQEE